MSPELPSSYPEEFHIGVPAAAPLDPEQSVNRLQELLLLRMALTRQARELYHGQAQAEEAEQNAQRQSKKLTQTLVALVDEFRRLLDDARKQTAAPPAEAVGPSAGWFGSWSLFRTKPTAANKGVAARSREWVEAFGRLLAMALGKLEDDEIHHVPLLGQDLKTLSYDGQLLKSWVAVKNRPQDGRLIVKEEIRGLWISRRNGKLAPVQGGEVTV